MSDTTDAARSTELAAASGYALGWMLKRLKANIHRRAEYYRTATEDPHQINQALHVAMLEVENSIEETVGDVRAHIEGGMVMPYRIIQRLQNSPLTGWLWNYWQHEETGRITLLPMWKNPGSRYTKLKLRE